MRYGAIYIAHNPRDGESIFKVGKTERLIHERMKELTSSTSNLGAYKARAYFIVAGVDEAERACHKRLSKYRVQTNREFFDIPFERLVHAVREVIEPYSASAFIPETEYNDVPDTSVKIDPKEKLEEIRKRNISKDEAWDMALKRSRETLEDWAKIIKIKAFQAKEKLVEESTLHWAISDDLIIKNEFCQYQPFCTVSVYAQFKEAPIALTLIGTRGPFSDLDLSRAIAEPKIVGKLLNEAGELVQWRENDDGRLGEISISTQIQESYHKENYLMPVPMILVSAAQIHYDDYHQKYKDQFLETKGFSSPEEAFEVFLEVVISNIVKTQYDIRKSGGTRSSRHGADRIRIVDSGKFQLEELKGKEEFEDE